ncbi:hypothetical protein [Christensenella tenuis]|uniref:Uncharacterized protein n=1 Tax=Christensenella tenuis TaxID=2763033 RepID=A0ABR7EGW6_9FIRM|nr:hypothetical protein [Christensenella tenuis]MBC5648997.1 hypothetical protein [Christensenella tenuis]
MEQLKLKEWQKKKLIFWVVFLLTVAMVYLGCVSCFLYSDKQAEDAYWDYYLHESTEYTETEKTTMQDATVVTVGTYVETVNSIDMKNSEYTVTFRCWFKWLGDPSLDMSKYFEIYNGTVNRCELLETIRQDGENYQLVRVNATISKTFWTTRFPLSSYQFRFYLKPIAPIQGIVFIPDMEHSSVNEKLNLTGFELERNAVGLCIVREDSSKFGSPFESDEILTYSEVMTAIELNRDTWGLYFKCIIALIGTNIWVLISVFVCAYHKVDSLNMIPAILFGTVSNILVGANLIPDAMYTGLLEYVNIWGIYTILISTVIIIQINRIRSEYQDHAFARKFGHIMFSLLLILTVLGYLILPVSAYRF